MIHIHPLLADCRDDRLLSEAAAAAVGGVMPENLSPPQRCAQLYIYCFVPHIWISIYSPYSDDNNNYLNIIQQFNRTALMRGVYRTNQAFPSWIIPQYGDVAAGMCARHYDSNTTVLAYFLFTSCFPYLSVLCSSHLMFFLSFVCLLLYLLLFSLTVVSFFLPAYLLPPYSLSLFLFSSISHTLFIHHLIVIDAHISLLASFLIIPY